jgi:hypothetical protein
MKRGDAGCPYVLGAALGKRKELGKTEGSMKRE